MRGLLIAGWLLVPALAAAWHYGPGQDQLALDDVGTAADRAAAAVAARDWAAADEAYGQALTNLPAGHPSSARLRLEQAKAWMLGGKLHQAHEELPKLVEELESDPQAPATMLAEARSADANAKYYAAWLLRLEGETQDVWEPEIDAARQTYKLLAGADNPAARQAHQDLEAAIRLARMDLSELQGLSLPCQCKCQGSCKGKCNGKGKKPGDKPKEPQKQDTRSAGGSLELPTGGH